MSHSAEVGLVLCDHHAELFGMRDPDLALRNQPPDANAIYVAFLPSSEAVPVGAVCDATIGVTAQEHDGALRLYTIQRVDQPEMG